MISKLDALDSNDKSPLADEELIEIKSSNKRHEKKKSASKKQKKKNETKGISKRQRRLRRQEKKLQKDDKLIIRHHVSNDITDPNEIKEAELIKTATKGVLELFNFVTKYKRENKKNLKDMEKK